VQPWSSSLLSKRPEPASQCSAWCGSFEDEKTRSSTMCPSAVRMSLVRTSSVAWYTGSRRVPEGRSARSSTVVSSRC
jgi:hypothetical protein